MADLRPELVWDLGALVSEGPIWLPDEEALRFVDIKRGSVHIYRPKTDARETHLVGGQPSFIAPTQSGGFLIGSNAAIHTLNGDILGDAVATISMPHHNRTNDGAVDCFGRLWFGTMDDEECKSTGQVFCLDRGQLHCVGCDAVVTNGPALSADGRTLYHVDSAERTIWRYSVEDGPRLTHRERFIQFAEADGYPDGVILDAEGCLWVAMWDGWCVRRYSSAGVLLQRIDLPCARVTKMALGGTDLRTAYVTTACIGLSDIDRANQPLAGALFAFEAPAPGLPTHSIRLS